MKILMIEDSNFDARVIKDMLSYSKNSEEFKLTWAKSLKEGKNLLRENHYDVILLDLTLPDSNGLDTLKSTYNDFPEYPIIVLTGINDDSISKRAVKEGSQDFLVKGQFTVDLLLRSIHYSIERHKMIMALRSMALIDQLTGLYNRHGFLNLAKHHLQLANRKGTKLMILYCDLDYLKYINDTYGHLMGDEVLKETADILRETFRESDILSRYGGDEFVVLAIDVKEGDEKSIVQRLEKNINLHNLHNKKFKISISTGGVIYNPETHRDINDLLNEADKLMYINKWEKKKKMKEN